MSQRNDRGAQDYSQYDAMTTEQLQQILRDDSYSAEEILDTDALFYIMGLLADRQKADNTTTVKTAEEAYARFQKHYMPRRGILGSIRSSVTHKNASCRLRPVTVIAAVLALVILMSLGAEAMGFNLYGKLVRWTKDIFYISSNPATSDPTNPGNTDPLEYQSLQEALRNLLMTDAPVPTWLPEGYALVKIQTGITPFDTEVFATYIKNEDELHISVRQIKMDNPVYIQKDDKPVEVYTVKDATYYIFSNLDLLQAVWVTDVYECHLTGYITIEEMKMILDSIGKDNGVLD